MASGAVSSLVSSGIEGIGQTGGTACVNGKDVPIMTEFGKSSGFKALMLASGGLSGGLSSSIAGGNFFDGVRQGLITSGLNHAMHSMMQEDPLKKHANKVKHSLEEWEARYHDKSWGEIATEAGWKDGQPLGPKAEWRYIKAPDGNVMDMRHVSIVGYGYGEGIGNIVEHLQNLVPRMRPSAFDPQDYYSNKIGAMYSQLRSMGSWSSNSWSYDFKRFIDTQYSTLFNNYKP